jgi:carboxypeptidase C (cathepsin A)
VAGYAKSFDKFIQVIVRNAGHSVAMDQPRNNLDMIRRFIYNLSFE